MGFFGIVNCTSGPDLKYGYSYTSILRLGLAAGDTPDAPHNRLGIRGPSNSPKFPTCSTKIGRHTRILLRKERSGVGPRTTSAREDPPMIPTRRAEESFLVQSASIMCIRVGLLGPLVRGGACLIAGAVSIPLEISLTLPLPSVLSPADIVLPVKI
ncbi:hypothetical protein F511_29244 [Dorcoceras hygrometricum]|uniref:Uncharacterized protein n=1 Tax=Dorcoceras hygrometricum TaxID=472368 RepID=A0A2Z7D2S9_9LAMI|nr:hypothetical protein F511_29244 [Dorcoceras hygrometricum]